MEKQHNRGQDGAGFASIKLDMEPGERYISRSRSIAKSPIQDIFDQINERFAQIAEENPMTYIVFPNPFSNKIKIQFSEISQSPTFIAIYTISGQSIWEKMYPEKIDEVNLTDFENVRNGKYVLHIVCKGKPFVASIVKE